MKTAFLLILLFSLSLITFSQTVAVDAGVLMEIKGDLYITRGYGKPELLLRAKNCSNCSKAISESTHAIAKNPNDGDAYNNRAVYKSCCLKDYKGAIEDYKKFIKIEKNPDANVYFLIASAYEKIQDYKGAIPYYDIIISNDTTWDNVFYRRGLAKIKSGNKTSGCSDLNKAKELGKKEADEAITKYCK
jgi:tetratricopeptide (TPR) repeat protein